MFGIMDNAAVLVMQDGGFVMAKMQIGLLHIIRGNGYWFACHCPKCKEKVFVDREVAKEFVDTCWYLSERLSLMARIKSKMPRIKVIIEKKKSY